MTSRPVPVSTQGRIVQTRVRPSSAAQYGASLVEKRREKDYLRQLLVQAGVDPSAIDQGPTLNSPENVYQNPADWQAYDPRMGYGQVVNPAALPRNGMSLDQLANQVQGFPDVSRYLDPQTGRISTYYPNSPAYQQPTFKSPFGSPLSPQNPLGLNRNVQENQFGVDPHDNPETASQRTVGNYYQGEANLYTDAANYLDQALSQLNYQRQNLMMKRDEALANAREDIAAQYDDQIAQLGDDISTLKGNLDDLNQRVPFTLKDVEGRFKEAVSAAEGIVAAAGPEFKKLKNQALQGIAKGYDDAASGLRSELEKIGAGEAATTALEGTVRELESMAYDTVSSQTDEVKALNEAASKVAETAARSAGLSSEVAIKRFAQGTEKNIKDSIQKLVDQRTKLQEAKARAWDNAKEKINQQFTDALGKITYQDQITFAKGVVESAMEGFFQENKFDGFQQAEMQQWFENLFGKVTSLNGFRDWVDGQKHQRNTLLRRIAAARESGDPDLAKQLAGDLQDIALPSETMIEGLETMWATFDSAMTEWSNNQPNPADFGYKGVGGNAANTNPQNIADARAGRGAYGARARYSDEVGHYIENHWTNIEGVGGINYFRPASESHGNGRSANSDHITSGALDIHIDPTDASQMKAGKEILSYLRGLGTVAYTIWEPTDTSSAHYNHIHVSFKLGAQGNVTSAPTPSTTQPNPDRSYNFRP